jgi:hypothetical protein
MSRRRAVWTRALALLVVGALVGGATRMIALAAAVAPATVPYKIVSERPNPRAGGFTRVLLISPKYTNEHDLRELGSELVELARSDPWAISVVFDDAGAARLFPHMDDDAQSAHYDRHLLLTYNKNAGGSHIEITPKGLNGPNIEVLP